MKKHLLFLLGAAAALVLFSVPPRAADEKTNPAAANNIDNYIFPPSGNIASRIYPTPQFILDYYAEIDKDLIAPDKPYRAYTPTQAEMAEIEAVIANLPEKFAAKIAPRLLGIYFVENLIGSGWGDWVPGKDGNNYFIMIFNSSVLKMSASEWITGKEKSVFVFDQPGYALEIDIGSGMSGFYYIFYHEITHIYDYIAKVTPGEDSMKSAQEYELMQGNAAYRKKYPYIDGVWKYFTTPEDQHNFPGRENITFYGLSGGPKIKISEAPAYYEKLKSTPFVTLYGTLNWMEDFSEYMAAYMSAVVMKRPWTLRITKDGKPIYEMNGVFDRALAQERRQFAEKLVK